MQDLRMFFLTVRRKNVCTMERAEVGEDNFICFSGRYTSPAVAFRERAVLDMARLPASCAKKSRS